MVRSRFKKNTSMKKASQRLLIIFPALAIVVSVGCAASSGAQSSPATAKASTTTAKKAISPSTTFRPKSNASNLATALSVLTSITIEKERPSGYARKLFKHWVDANGNGCDTREEVLIAESLTNAQVDAYGCKVVAGDWLSLYDNVSYTEPGELDIDHMIPLKEAWDSGAWNWSATKRQLFANDLSDPRSLIAVTAGQNRSKSDKDPSNWIPPRSNYVCTYLAEWIAIKAQWKLSMDQSEFGRIRNLLNESCATTTIATWGTFSAVPAPAVSETVTVPGTRPIAETATVVNTTAPVTVANSAVAVTSSVTVPAGVREVTPVRCKATEAGLIGRYKGMAYICSPTRQNGEAYVVGYFYWRPA